MSVSIPEELDFLEVREGSQVECRYRCWPSSVPLAAHTTFFLESDGQVPERQPFMSTFSETQLTKQLWPVVDTEGLPCLKYMFHPS